MFGKSPTPATARYGTARLGALRRVRGLHGCWQTYDVAPGAVRDVHGWDARARAAIDGGGLTTWGDNTDPGSDDEPTDHRDRTRRTTHATRTTRTRSGRRRTR